MQDGQVYDFGTADVLNRKAIWDVYGIHGEVVSVGEQKLVLVDSKVTDV